MAKKDQPMRGNSLGVFEDDELGAKYKVAKTLIRQGRSLELIAKSTGLSLSEVKRLAVQVGSP